MIETQIDPTALGLEPRQRTAEDEASEELAELEFYAWLDSHPIDPDQAEREEYEREAEYDRLSERLERGR